MCDHLSVIISESLSLEQNKIIFENLVRVSENLVKNGVVETEFKNNIEYLIVRKLSRLEKELHGGIIANAKGGGEKIYDEDVDSEPELPRTGNFINSNYEIENFLTENSPQISSILLTSRTSSG